MRETGNYTPGRVLAGDEAQIRLATQRWRDQRVDQEWLSEEGYPHPRHQTTLARVVRVTGPGTFFRRALRTLSFEPTADTRGWWFAREDLQYVLPIHVTASNVWTTVRNIVLCSGNPHNYMRMVEHIIALRLGMGLDNCVIRMRSGDPPLFDRSSLEMLENLESAGLAPQPSEVRYVTVREPVTVGGPHGAFLTLLPDEKATRRLDIDCAVDFRSAIGRQRIRFTLNRDTFRHGALARTNTTLGMVLFVKTIGQLFADMRNMGYNMRNILVAGRWRYINTPRLLHEGRPLEAVWHRATLDLLAALALIDRGRLCGTVVSYKAGHALDVKMVRALYQHDLLREL